jgi:hypothetical protein
MRLAPFISSFANELEKIALAKQANAGAIIGGVAGLHYTPGGLKSKAMGALLGAGILGGGQAAATGAKRALWDEPKARERAELNYVPGYAEQGSPYNAANFY